MARPSFKATPAMKRRVSIAAGGGMSHEEIALGLGITKPTLYKYFSHELSVVAYQRRLEVLEAMHKAAKSGNVAAQKAYAALTPHAAAPDEPAPEAKPALGKKDQQNADAKTAHVGTEWDSLLRPGTPLQ